MNTTVQALMVSTQQADDVWRLIAALRPFCIHVSWDLDISDAEYMESHIREFRGMGRVFEFLDLAEPDTSNVLRWKAKPELYEIAGQAKLLQVNSEGESDDDWTFDLEEEPVIASDKMSNRVNRHDRQSV